MYHHIANTKQRAKLQKIYDDLLSEVEVFQNCVKYMKNKFRILPCQVRKRSEANEFSVLR